MNEPQSEKVLALGASLDEVVVGFGATVAAAVLGGHAVRVALSDPGVVTANGNGSGNGGTLDRGAAATTELAPDALRTLGIAEVWPLPAVERSDLLIDRLKALLVEWAPQRVLVAAHRGNASLLFALRSALSQIDGPALLEVAEYGDPLPVDRVVDLGEFAPRKQAALAALAQIASDGLGERLERAGRLRGVRGGAHADTVESFRALAPAERERDLLWGCLEALGPTERSAEPPIVSVIVRTKNRADLLAEALASLRAQTLRPFETIVVNDDGVDVAGVVAGIRDLDVRLIDARPGVGRSEAANLGLRAARGRYVAFLDDDDRFLPHHLQMLVDFLDTQDEFAGAYADVDVVELEWKEGQPLRERRRRRSFAQDFDRDLLLFGNYVPIIALVVRREVALEAGELRSDLDLLEDWDFLIRLTRRHALRRVPVLGAEYRIRDAGGNQTRLHPWGSLEESLARIDVTRRHFAEITPEAVVRCYRLLMERSFRAEYDVEERTRELVLARQRAARAEEAVAAADATAAAARAEADASEERQRLLRDEVVRRLDDENEFLSTELVRRGEALEAQAHALARLGSEIERLSVTAGTHGREAAGLHREVERREELIRAMRSTRLWRMRDWLRRGLGR